MGALSFCVGNVPLGVNGLMLRPLAKRYTPVKSSLAECYFADGDVNVIVG